MFEIDITNSASLRTFTDFASADDSNYLEGDVVLVEGHGFRKKAGSTTGRKSGWEPIPLPVFRIQQWGIDPEENDGTTALSTGHSSAIQEAIDHIESSGGGILDFGFGQFAIDETIVLGSGEYPCLLTGRGRGHIMNSKLLLRQSSATRFVWIGTSGGKMIHVTPDPNNVGSSDRRFGGGIVDVHLDGAESGGIGIHVQSHSGHCIRVHTSYFTNVHFLSDVLSNDLANGPQDVQDFVWDLVSTDVNTANEADALVVINGSDSVSPAANTSIGFIPNMRLMAESSAVAMHLGNCDALTFGRVHADTRTAATGDGGKIIAHATDTLPSGLGTTSADGRSRHLHFDFVQSPEGFVAKDTVSAGTAASAITIDHYSLGNGAELPTEEAAAHQISYRTSGGDDVIRSVSGVIIDPIHSYGGTANAIQITTGAELSEIPTGMRIRFKATAENTGATTIQVDSAPSASAETVIGMPLPSGYIRTDVHTEAFFDGTNWVVDREDEIILGAGGILARYANGQQLCGAGIPLSYFSGLQLIGSWAYNADFASVPIISGSIDTTDFNSNVTPNLEDCTGVNNGSSTVSGCSLNIRRAAGTTNFASGDVTTVQLSAVGVWYLPY